jgi:choline monooxygenase
VALDPQDFQVEADIAQARALPAQAFTSSAFLEQELQHLFPRAWLLLPERPAEEHRSDPRSLADLVRRRGSRAPTTLLDKPLYLQRDWKGTLRAFPNVCTHAWHTLVEGPERSRTVTCPQHGRQFDDAGTCLLQPGLEKAKDFPGAEDHLAPLGVQEWGPFLFASLGAAQPFEGFMAPVQASLQGYPLEALQRAPMAGEVRELQGNWKQHAWNYLDSLHIPFIHRRPGGLADAVDLDSYRTELHGDAVLQWAYAKDPAHGLDPGQHAARFRHPRKRVFALWWFVWPDLTLNVYPWGVSVNVYQPLPGRPGETRFLWYHHVLDPTKWAERDAVWKMREVDDEDVDALVQVKRGAASGFAPRGRFPRQRAAAPGGGPRAPHARAAPAPQALK